jgi:hypothetical protein
MAAEELLSRSGYRSAVTTTAGCNTVGINAYRLLRMQIGDDRSISSYSFDLARMLLDGDAASHGKIDAIPTGKNSAVLQSKSTIGL